VKLRFVSTIQIRRYDHLYAFNQEEFCQGDQKYVSNGFAGFASDGCCADAAVQKSARISQYSDTVSNGSCVSLKNEDWRCYGPQGKKGWMLDISDTGNVIFTTVRHASAPEKGLALNGRSLGEKVEWRGQQKAGVFQADALIVRMRPSEDDGQISDLLWVVKLNKTGSCLASVVDAKANKEPNTLARVAADKLPDICGAKPRFSGVSSAAALAAIAQAQE
jgi:hypothetical protein